MKEFFVNGERANWANLNVTALNVKSGILCNETVIPEHLRLKVTIADKFDTNAPDLDEVSEATSEYAMRHGKHRHFLLLNGNRVVGWAAFHRKDRGRGLSKSRRTRRERKTEWRRGRLGCGMYRDCEVTHTE